MIVLIIGSACYYKYHFSFITASTNNTTSLRLLSVIELLIASAKGEDDDLTSSAEAEGDEAAETCGDEEGLRAFGVPVVELFAQ